MSSGVIAGNAPEDIKELVKDVHSLFNNSRPKAFASSVVSHLTPVEVTFRNNITEPHRKEASVVYKITVDEEMVNGGGHMHGGCSAFLIDVCSSICIVALKVSEGGSALHVSQSMNIVYHAPAAIGEALRIVNTTMAAGRRVTSARTEIWSETNHRLVASGIHIKMEPSTAKL